MSRLPDVSEHDTKDNRSWFSLRPFPVFIIVAWSFFSLIDHRWTAIIKIVVNGELGLFGFLFIILYPLLLLWAGIALMLLKRYSLYLFIISLAIGSFRLTTHGYFLSHGPIDLIISSLFIIYCLWLQRTKILK